MTQRIIYLLSALVLAFSFDVSGASAEYPELQSPELPSHTCRMQGIVMKSEQHAGEKKLNAPSALNDVYTRLTLRVQHAVSYDDYREHRSLSRNTVLKDCNSLVKKDLDTTFRLCSNIKPKIGDIVMGIGSISTIENKDTCLFDIRVVGNALKELRERERIERLKAQSD